MHDPLAPEAFWQSLLPAGSPAPPGAHAASLPDGRTLLLPIRQLPNGSGALASLIINQASFAVLDSLAGALAALLAPHRPEIIVGLPTLGLTLAAAVAQKLGHPRYVPCGTSAKFWYRAELSVPLSSVTTPDQAKRLFIDPRMLPLLQGRRIALIDDVISSGRSIEAGLSLLATCGLAPTVIGCAMLQTDRAAPLLAGQMVETVLRTPLLPADGCTPRAAMPSGLP